MIARRGKPGEGAHLAQRGLIDRLGLDGHLGLIGHLEPTGSAPIMQPRGQKHLELTATSR